MELQRDNCPRRCVLVYDNASDKVYLLNNFLDHHHIQQKRVLTDDQKSIIKSIYGRGVTKPSFIIKLSIIQTKFALSRT